jgi:hypothetical protein
MPKALAFHNVLCKLMCASREIFIFFQNYILLTLLGFVVWQTLAIRQIGKEGFVCLLTINVHGF